MGAMTSYKMCCLCKITHFGLASLSLNRAFRVLVLAEDIFGLRDLVFGCLSLGSDIFSLGQLFFILSHFFVFLKLLQVAVNLQYLTNLSDVNLTILINRKRYFESKALDPSLIEISASHSNSAG
jgi:hypothetical protein